MTAQELTPRRGSGKSVRICDGNHDGNDGSRQRPNAAVNSHVLSQIRRQLGIRYTCEESRRSAGMLVAGITELTSCTAEISFRLWTAEAT